LLLVLLFFVVCAWCFCVSIVLKRRLNCSSLGFPQRHPNGIRECGSKHISMVSVLSFWLA
jgi:hypothetical protein